MRLCSEFIAIIKNFIFRIYVRLYLVLVDIILARMRTNTRKSEMLCKITLEFIFQYFLSILSDLKDYKGCMIRGNHRKNPMCFYLNQYIL